MGQLTRFPSPHEGPVLVVPPAPRWLGAARALGWRVQCAPLARAPFDQSGALVVATPSWTPAQVVLALSRGAGVVLDAGGAALQASVIADARRLGAVLWPESALAPVPPRELDEDTVDLLDRLARGSQVGAAARDANMSLRTAHRRLRQAREALRATTTAEAVGRWAQRSNGLAVVSR